MNFLEKLQSTPEPVKRRWLISLTAVLMVVVIYVWLAYFNNLIIAGFSQPAVPSSAEPGQIPEQPNPMVAGDSVSLWQTLRNSAANLYGIFTEKLRALGDILNAPREYIIKPPQ